MHCSLRLLLPLWAGLSFCVSAQPQILPEDGVSTEQLVLWIFVLDYENQPAPDVQLRCQLAGTTLQTLYTDEEGKLLIRGTALGQIVRARVEDANYLCYDETQEGEIGGRPLAFLVFPRRSGSGDREQRIAMHQAKIRAILAAREQTRRRIQPVETATSPVLSGPAVATDPILPIAKDPVLGNPVTRHITAFVAGLRHEDARGLEEKSAPTTQTATAEIRIIDRRGQPIADALVSALVLDPQPEKGVSLAAVERSESDGRVIFRGLMPERWHRIECVDQAEGEGRSTLFTLLSGQLLTLRPLVVRPREQTVSGFVIHSRGPAAFARVALLDVGNRRLLTTVADAHGYFILGPTPPDPVMLEVAYRMESGGMITLTLPVERDAPEVLIPIDALQSQP
jgi:hypothetical protein